MVDEDRKPHRPGSSRGLDLLRMTVVRRMLLWGGFPYVLQAVMLLAFVLLACLGWGLFAPPDADGKLFAKVNLVNLTIWGLWWPAMVFGAVFLGRLWCMVCPLELVANLTERAGRRLGIRQLTLGRWLRSGALILAIYAVIQLLVAGAHLHRVPAYTSIFLWTLLAVAAIVGLLWKDRAFCRAFCPVGLLLGTYGRGGMLAVRAGSHEPCNSCDEKHCTQPAGGTRLDARSCPGLLNPARLDTNRDCLVCGQCIKACKPDNVQLLLRRPFHPADARETLAAWPVTLFVMLASGFVAYELSTELPALWTDARTGNDVTGKAIFLWIPDWLSGKSAHAGWIKGIWMLFVFPALLWTVLGGLVLLGRGAASLGEAWRRLALPVVVVVAAGHMAKGLAKISSWGGYLPGALRDPWGTTTIAQLAADPTAKPDHLLLKSTVSIVGVLLVLLLGYFALRESRLADTTTHRSRLAPILLVTAVSLAAVWGWGFL